MRKPRVSKKARQFIGHKIVILRHEGYKPLQAEAIAFSMAREHGFHIPSPHEHHRAMRKIGRRAGL